jgi:hypothetical protein
MSRAERVGIFALAPLYALMHLAVLVPLRLWALCSLRRAKWGTRQSIEVALAIPLTANQPTHPRPVDRPHPARPQPMRPAPQPPVIDLPVIELPQLDWAIPVLARALGESAQLR